MMLIFGLMLLQTAACLELNCSFNQKDQICYAALGHKLNLQMLNASEYDLKLIKIINNSKDNPVCRVKNDKMKECDLYINRTEVMVINGTVMINHVIRADSGNYRLEYYDGGRETSKYLQVIVEAPIGSVNVSTSCSSNQSSVFCSSEGDQITYNWALNGKILDHGPMVRNTTIQLNKTSAVGNISCSVKNNVSHAQTTISLEPCPEPTTPAVTSSLTSAVTISTQTSDYGTSLSSAGVNSTHTQRPEPMSQMFLYYLIAGCTALILILLFITVCYVYKKKRLKSTPAAAGDTELTYTEKNETESLPAADVEYAAVSRQTKRKEKKKKEEDEVQYGEVTFTPNRPNAPQQLQEECIYSQVVRS